MRRNGPRPEIEIKLRVTDIAALRKRLRQIGGRLIVPRTFESNTLYDTRGSDLRRRGRLLRIRIEEPARNLGGRPPAENSPALLTYKAPWRSTRRGRTPASYAKTRSRFKVRREAELSLTSAGQMAAILRALGLTPKFRYEKLRTTYALAKEPGLRIELDETPIGNYLELEGPAESINRAAHLLGYTSADYQKDTYGSLYFAECRRQGRKPGDMIFPPQKIALTFTLFLTKK